MGRFGPTEMGAVGQRGGQREAQWGRELGERVLKQKMCQEVLWVTAREEGFKYQAETVALHLETVGSLSEQV